jgi:hypothetical protein
MLKSLLISLFLHTTIVFMVFLDYFLYENVKIQSVNINVINYDKIKNTTTENHKDNNKKNTTTENTIDKKIDKIPIKKIKTEVKERKTKDITSKKRNDIIVSKEISLDEKVVIDKEQFKNKNDKEKILTKNQNNVEKINKEDNVVELKNNKDDLFDKMINSMEKDIEKKQEKEDFLKDVGIEEKDFDSDQRYELSAENVEIINRQFSQCWFATVGFLSSETEYINLKLHMNINGSIDKIEINESDEKLQDEKFKVLLNQVTRALKNPKCSIIKFPKNEYYKWKIIYMKFKPQRKL